MERDKLKIEFRAVPYGRMSRILEYRISPEQDLTYRKEYKILFGFIRFSFRKKYRTKWRRASMFRCGMNTHYYAMDDIAMDIYHSPLYCNTEAELLQFKERYKTIGEFEDYLYAKEQSELDTYHARREKYLSDRKKVWY